MTSSMTTSYTADAPPVAAADDAPPAVTPASNMSQHERQRKYDAKMEEMGMTSGAPDDAKSVNTASSTAAVSVGSNTTTTTTTTRSSNSTSNARSVPFSNMSERERQRRYDSKMADMGIVEEGAADAAPAPVQASRPGGPRNTTFSNMSEDERQRKYEAKMGEGNDPAAVAGAAHTANNNTNDNVSQKILNDYASQTSSKEITLGGGSSTNTNNNGITTTANYGMATAPQVEYGTYEVLQSEKENEKAVPVRTSEGEFAGGDLAVAMAINEDEEAALGGKIAYAMEYDPDSKPPVYKNRRFQLYGVIGVILLIVVGAGVGIGVSSGGSDDTSRSMDQIPMATNPPTIFLTVKEDKVYNFLTTYFSPKVMEEGTPHKMAAEWSLKEDRLSDDMTEGDLGIDFLQRYVLAFLWYHTTDNGNKPWRSCNPRDVTVDENDTCTFLKWEQLENDDVCFKEVEGVNRWMSGAETCLWQGVDCSSGSEVLGIDLCTYPQLPILYCRRCKDVCLTRYCMCVYLCSFCTVWQGLTGTLPTELVALTSLQKVMFAYNELTGQIPPEYANIRTLFSLEIHGNVLTGKIPDAFYEAASETGALVLLNVGDNQLSGTLDTRIGLMTDLKGLHFFDNKFTGTLPTELGNLRYLSYSRGHGNQLSGSLPTELGRVRQLTEFWYHQCGLSGSIPSEMGKMKRMKSFRIWGNDLSVRRRILLFASCFVTLPF
jgi:hypothetical protein